MSKTTPMMRQYYEIKAAYPGCILLFRLGDFYEMFGEDAKLASRLLQITLTSREAGKDRRIPMCGVPYHSIDGYIAELVRQGHKVALCEQVEDPKTAKGVVRREVVRVFTPGTVMESDMLDSKENNYLVAVTRKQIPPRAGTSPKSTALFHGGNVEYGLAACDLSTGEFMCTHIDGDDAFVSLKDEIARLRPAELLFDPAFDSEEATEEKKALIGIISGVYEMMEPRHFSTDSARRRLLNHFNVESLEGFGCENLPLATIAAGAVLAYLESTQLMGMAQITSLKTYSTSAHMLLDQATRRNLELTRTLRTAERRGSLLWVLDATRTAMGSRLLKRWIEQPLLDVGAIERRLDAVEELVEDMELRHRVRESLDRVHDIERLSSRIATSSANARELVSLKDSLLALPELKADLSGAKCDTLLELAHALDPCEDIAHLIQSALVDDPPISVTEGDIIKEGYSPEVDELKQASREGKEWIARLERQERERTGIKSLKVGFNKVFGYFIEVTRANLANVPDDYERKQTLANAERFVTPELKEKEAQILGAEERVTDLEYRLFVEVREAVAAQTHRLQLTGAILSELDVYSGLAQVAVDRRYVRPVFEDNQGLHIKSGRHPVVEAMLEDGSFVPNDADLDQQTQIIVLTGPNMAGKSTYLRQVALIVLMAQIGSFVPAASAKLTPMDRIFTRVGASDDLATGQSTFMVEMNEVANILNHATERSLVVLDEVGRGTSTFDGLSIAWSVTEFLHNHPTIRPKTLFATHYHELTELENLLPRVKNYSVAVHKDGSDIVFLRRIVRGGVDQSYGIEVARLAGLPKAVIQRAQEILKELESGEERRVAKEAMTWTSQHIDSAPDQISETNSTPVQLSLLIETDPIIEQLARINTNEMTPLEALVLIADLAEAARQRTHAGG